MRSMTTAAAILADAFFHDPVMTYTTPLDARRIAVNERLFRSSVKHAQNCDGGVLSDDHSAALWLPSPRIILSTGDIFRAGLIPAMLHAGPSSVARILNHEKACDPMLKPHLQVEAAYLWALGVVRTHHGRGIGAALMEQTLEAVRTTKKYNAMLLKTENPRNLPFYQRLGFAVVHQNRVEKTGLDVWIMKRELV